MQAEGEWPRKEGSGDRREDFERGSRRKESSGSREACTKKKLFDNNRLRDNRKLEGKQNIHFEQLTASKNGPFETVHFAENLVQIMAILLATKMGGTGVTPLDTTRREAGLITEPRPHLSVDAGAARTKNVLFGLGIHAKHARLSVFIMAEAQKLANDW
jgi:hypothetical protein|eukprot:CAMPEP_0174287968 /NCGR_PEP_ID=MMETSP0809-20121228/18544_1 /TAXON_ID=73025 ORGANISM="Eutreptiella gymnastica-like, Strain CCMP1594" /NCGR_SAMPLE_ID=MMETSP0809 /ASSEMBLY_ACC=CAM_ASM_000658 /LENGTH=158 /DNA_ID=CAMNT_0015384843 /DNA_START=968 /DNA_END=1441 /DNA_ORIENTATION=+